MSTTRALNQPAVTGAALASPASYRPRDPTRTLLYRVIEGNWLSFVREREQEGRFLPAFVTREFKSFLTCGVLAAGFMRLKCDDCRHEKLVAFSCKRRGFCTSCGARRMSEQAAFLTDWVLPPVPVRQWVVSFPIQLRYWMARDSSLLSSVLAIVIRTVTGFQRQKAKEQGFKSGESGSVTLVQRFGGSANLNIHFHTLMIEGVYGEEDGKSVFHELTAPTNEEVKDVLRRIQTRVVRHLTRKGLLATDGASSDEEFIEGEATIIDLCQGASVQSRIACGERAGQRVRKLGSFGLGGEPVLETGHRCASLGGFSLHANTSVPAGEKERLENLCRYVARPPIAEMRLKESKDGGIIYQFKKQWSDGTQAVYFSPHEFLEKLVALIPPPRIHLTRFHGVLAPHHRLRAQIVTAQPKKEAAGAGARAQDGEAKSKRDPRRLSWSELLKRVFQLDLTTCPDCGGTLRFIAAIMERAVVEQILTHLGLPTTQPTFHPPRPPPQEALWEDFSA